MDVTSIIGYCYLHLCKLWQMDMHKDVLFSINVTLQSLETIPMAWTATFMALMAARHIACVAFLLFLLIFVSFENFCLHIFLLLLLTPCHVICIG